MKKPIITATEAVKKINDEDTLAIEGFGGIGFPEELVNSLEVRFLKEGKPHNLTLVWVAGPGDFKGRGLSHLAHEKLVKRVIGSHFVMNPKFTELINGDRIEAYALPQGVIAQLFRSIAGGRPGLISHVGLKTYVDPRLQGAKCNKKTTEDLIELITIRGREQLLYYTFPLNMSFIRGTTADELGNISLEKEGLTLEILPIAQATKNSGGITIAQVERVALGGSLPYKSVTVPGYLVDYIVVARPEHHWQSFGEVYNPAYSGEIRVPLMSIPPLLLDERKIICRRALLEFYTGAIINLGFGIPEGISNVANEEGVLDLFDFTVESGSYGGLASTRLDMGLAANAYAVIDQPYQFDSYDGGLIDVSCLSFVEADAKGNVNATKLRSLLIGPGGYINISQNAKKVTFVGTMTTRGLEIKANNGKLEILKEGNIKKFVSQVQQITFSGEYSLESGQECLYVTERAVFKLTCDGMVLVEIAPGIDLEKDVLAQMEFMPIISPELKEMDPRIFHQKKMGVKKEF